MIRPFPVVLAPVIVETGLEFVDALERRVAPIADTTEVVGVDLGDAMD